MTCVDHSTETVSNRKRMAEMRKMQAPRPANSFSMAAVLGRLSGGGGGAAAASAAAAPPEIVSGRRPDNWPDDVYHLNRVVWAAPGSEEEKLHRKCSLRFPLPGVRVEAVPRTHRLHRADGEERMLVATATFASGDW